MTEQKPEYQAGITPQRQVAAETPTTTAPTRPWQRWGEYGWWLGDSERRYGKLHLSRNLPVKVKLEMLRDPVIALTAGFVAATLVKAKRVIECQDEGKRRFFEAMFHTWEREFVLQASMAALLGSCGLIKRFAFKVPQPREIDAEPVWTNAATPYVIEGFDQAYPVGCAPRFDNKRRAFQGIDHLDGKVDVFFSLWITLGQYLAFGDYWGKGRLENSYKHWWIKNFTADNFLVWVQRQINPSTQVDYPPGKDDGDTNREVAIATGNAVRAGSTVALPSTVYDTIDPMSGEESLSSVRKWAISFLESSGNVGRFHEIEDQCDRGMALGMLVPPQSFLNVKQTALGGPTTADVLMALADELLMMDCADLDRHVNDYVFPAVARANFPPGSPRVRVRTVGLEKENTELLHDIIGKLLQRPDVAPTIFDLRGALEQERMPVVERDGVTEADVGEMAATAIAAQIDDKGVTHPIRQPYEQEIKERTRDVFEEYRPLIVEAAKSGEQPPYDDLEKALIAAILAVLVGAARRRADQVQDEMNLYVDGAMLEGELVEWSRNYSKERAGQLVGYTRTLVDRARRTDSEEDFDRLVDRAFSERRSRDISWTEVTFAVSAGYMIIRRLFEELHNVVMDDIWFTQLDERVCPVCAPLHGTRREVWDEMFPDGPPAHPLCRCFTLPQKVKVKP